VVRSLRRQRQHDRAGADFDFSGRFCQSRTCRLHHRLSRGMDSRPDSDGNRRHRPGKGSLSAFLDRRAFRRRPAGGSLPRHGRVSLERQTGGELSAGGPGLGLHAARQAEFPLHHQRRPARRNRQLSAHVQQRRPRDRRMGQIHVFRGTGKDGSFSGSQASGRHQFRYAETLPRAPDSVQRHLSRRGQGSARLEAAADSRRRRPLLLRLR